MATERTDLNLFRVFDAILTHGSLAGAARELGLTASAVSHALSRLRALLGNELFLHGQGGMTPTARAREIAPDVRKALQSLAAAMEPSPFDPARSRRIFQIGASDGVSMTVLPPLLRHLGTVAPALHLRVVPVGRLDLVQQMDEGRLDLVIGWFGAMPQRIRRRRLYDEREAMVVRHGHPLTQGALTPERLLSFPHLVVEFTGTEAQSLNGFYDDRGVLRRTWLERLLVDWPDAAEAERKVAVTVPGYGAIGPVLAATDLVATMPSRLAHRSVERDGLVTLELPYEPLVVTIEAAWHERGAADDGLNWLIQSLGTVLGHLAEAPA